MTPSSHRRALVAALIALVALVERLSATPNAILDVQWSTPHLESLGVVTVPRSVYLGRLARALDADEFTSIRRDPS